MSQKLYLILFCLVILLGFVLRVLPLLHDSFYFTMDQGNDAVHVREILISRKILLRGPETGIEGVFHGALWYYFISIGYALFSGHPAGAVFMMILLNLALTAIIMRKISQNISSPVALIVGAALQVFWWFYDNSRYAFNPFPLVFLSFILVFFLVDYLAGKKKSFIWAAIPVGLAFHCESAGAVAFAAFYFLVGFWGVYSKRLSLKFLIFGILTLLAFFIPRLISESQSNFSQSKALINEIRDPYGIFSHMNYQYISIRFKSFFTKRIIPQNDVPSIILMVVILALYKSVRNKNKFVKRYVILCKILIVISWVWFGSNKGWQSWHTVYIRPLLFVSILMMLFELPKKIGWPILLVILVSQIVFFRTRYLEYLYPSSDPSVFANEIASVDWVYQNSQGQGFYEYNYLPSVLDYPYQYLFWWRGINKYGYLPCEYSSFPGSPKLFLPSAKPFEQPKRNCGNFRFLVVEPDEHQELRNLWLDGARKGTDLIEEKEIGKIHLEKRLLFTKQ